MNKTIRFVVAFLFLLGWTVPLAAQRPEQSAAARERIRENINRLRLLRMTEELELSEQQTAVIFPAASRMEKEKAELSKKIHQEILDLRALLRAGDPDEQELARKVEAIKELRRAIQEKDEAFERVLEEKLTEIQKARYLLFNLDFYRVMGEKLEKARRIYRDKRGG